MPKIIDVEQLFQTTVRMYAERGYSGTTTQEVSRQAGVNEATLFRRFGNKAGLLVQALTHCLSQSPLAQVVSSEDVHVDLVAIVNAYLETNQLYGGAVITLLNDVPMHPELRDVLDSMKENLARAGSILLLHQERGVLRQGNPIQMITFLLSPLMMVGLWQRAEADAPVAVSPEEYVERFLEGYGQRKP